MGSGGKGLKTVYKNEMLWGLENGGYVWKSAHLGQMV